MKWTKLKSFILEQLKKKTVQHIIYWTVSYVGIFLTVMFVDSPTLAVEITTVLIAPAVVYVYAHFYIQRRFFEARQYAPYLIGLVILIVTGTLLHEFVFRLFNQDPNSHISGLATSIFFIIFSTASKYFRRGVAQQYRLQEAESKQLQMELSLLKSQINPHFFFNTLNNLYSLSLDQSERVPDVILQLSGLMRYVLDSSRKKTVPLNEEIGFIQSYIELEKLRLSGKVDIRVDQTDRLNGQSIAPMLLVPFIENSFKHGLSADAKAGYLHIKLALEETTFSFSVINSKSNSSSDTNGLNGMGIINVKRRLELMYPDRHRLEVTDNGDHYTVDLRIDLS